MAGEEYAQPDKESKIDDRRQGINPASGRFGDVMQCIGNWYPSTHSLLCRILMEGHQSRAVQRHHNSRNNNQLKDDAGNCGE